MTSFDDAVRRLLGAPDFALVRCEISGGGEVQIGEMTWETEPTEIEVEAYVPEHMWRRKTFKEAHPEFDSRKKTAWTRTFNTLPELWAALHEEN